MKKNNAPANAMLTKGAITRQIIRLAIPVNLMLLLFSGSEVIEYLFIAQLGAKELKAISFSIPISAAFFVFFMGINTGLVSLISRSASVKEHRELSLVISSSLLLVVLLAFIFSMVGYVTISPLFLLLHIDQTSLSILKPYMQIWYVSAPGFAFFLAVMGVYRALGNVKTPLFIVIGSSVIAVVLEPILIFGLAGAPKLGVLGAAIALCIVRTVVSMFALLALYKDSLLSFHVRQFGKLVATWKEILHVGIIAAVSQVIPQAGNLIIISIFAKYTQWSVISLGIIFRIENIAIIPFVGLVYAIGPIVGQNWQVEQYGRVIKAIKTSAVFSMILALLIFIILFLIKSKLFFLFSNNNLILSLCFFYFTVLPLTYGFWGIQLICGSSFNAIGNPWPGLIFTVIRFFGIIFPGTILFIDVIGDKGVFIIFALSNIIVGTFAWVATMYYFTQKKQMFL